MIEYDLTLTVIQGRNLGDRLTFNLEPGTGLHLGRGKENDLVIPDPQVSKLHAFIELTDVGPKLFDLKSTAGTMLMGFPVGTDGETLRQQDEFKLASTVLSVDWQRREIQKAAKENKSFKFDWKDKNVKLGIAGGLLIILLLLLGGGSGSSISSVGQSDTPVQFSATKTYGYIRGGDHSHPYEIKVDVPAGDLNIEFQAMTAIPVNVFRNDVLVGRIGVTENWERYSLLLRDEIDGDNGVLKFVGNAKDGKLKEWAISRLRFKQLENEDLPDDKIPTDIKGKLQAVTDSLQECLQSSLVMYNTPSGMWNARVALHETLLLIMNITYEVGALIPISEVSPPPSINRFETELKDLIAAPQKSPTTEEELKNILTAKEAKLIELLSEFESELWRRSLNKLNGAVLAAKAQNYRQALLDRMSIEQSFPDTDDLRFKDTRAKIDKVIPKKVLSKPERYLREKK